MNFNTIRLCNLHGPVQRCYFMNLPTPVDNEVPHVLFLLRK